MRAVQFDQFGEPGDVLHTTDSPQPRLEPGHVRVRMLATPINPSDLMTVRGIYGHRPNLPAIPGYEGTGEVADSGGGLLGRLLVGRRVAVLNRDGGCWAEETVVPAKQCVPLPKSMPLEQAAMFFVNPVTAFVLTHHVLELRKQDWLIQSAGASSLGQMIVRLGKHQGFRTLCIVRRDDQRSLLLERGADEVVVYDEHHDPPHVLADRIREATSNAEIRAAIDPVGGKTGSGILSSLSRDGRLIVFGSLANANTEFSPRHLLTNQIRIEGFWLAKWMEAAPLTKKLAVVHTVKSLVSRKILQNDVGPSFGLDQIAEAVRHSERPGREGKAWLRIGANPGRS